MTSVVVQFNKDVKWDNWGHMVTVFKKDDVVTATDYGDGQYAAETPYFKGISDFIYPEDFNILARESSACG